MMERGSFPGVRLRRLGRSNFHALKTPLLEVPTLIDLEQALRALKASKAPGLDGLGAELFLQHSSKVAKRIFPIMIKCAVRRQNVAEWLGGWLLPLYKGKDPRLGLLAENLELEPVIFSQNAAKF